MWLNMWPEVKSKTAMREMAAHRLRFWRMGRRYGPATAMKEMAPRTETVLMMSFIQLKGRLKAGAGVEGRPREIQSWIGSALLTLCMLLVSGMNGATSVGECCLPRGKVEADRSAIWFGVDASGWREEEEDGGGLQLHLQGLLVTIDDHDQV